MKHYYQFRWSLSSRILTLILLIFSFACHSGKEKKESNNSEKEIIETAAIQKQLEDGFQKSKLIFYSLPSPLETSMLIKKAGADFNVTLLNPPENLSKYQTNYKMALNLGIYSADLSYATLFDQSETTIEYMGVARKLADELGILGAVDEETIKKLEENMNNREVVMDIISESYMNANAYLSDNNRAAVSVMVLAGGWIEGLYLATSLTNGSVEENKNLVERILYQKLSLETLLSMLDTYATHPDVAKLIAQFEDLKEVFNKVTIVNTSPIEAETDTLRRMTIIRAGSEIDINPNDFALLCKKIEEMRSDFVS
ncbi:hypothetical protein ACT29H_14110 [Thermophagus sp. OGC60D27]|uniref:hypothetical protein n=1 Tax=Thermophagus sp. OGC60D27 TaxID=3458415 RepID=UPI004037CC44